MTETEAEEIVETQIAMLRSLSYDELMRFRKADHREVQGASGRRYELESQAFWDNPHEKTNLRVLVSALLIKEGWRGRLLQKPLAVGDFIIAPDGRFLGG